MDDEEKKQWRPEPDKIGICCSGGGIRSAAYNLGALQALQKAGKLQNARYLAAVSGGAYIAAAFSIVQKEIATPDAQEDTAKSFRDVPPYQQGTPEERWLRNHSSYLAPGLVGKVRLLATLMLGLTLNLLLVGTLVTIVAIPLGVLGAALEPRLHIGAAGRVALPLEALRFAWLAVGVTGVLGLLCALVATATRLGDAPDNPTIRIAKWLAGLALIGLALLGLPQVVLALRNLTSAVTGLGIGDPKAQTIELTGVLGLVGAAGLPPLVLGVVRSWLHREAQSARFKRLRSWLTSPRVAAAWVAPALLITGFLLVYNMAAGWGWQARSWAWIAVSLLVLTVLYLGLDPNSSSLYTVYKQRLCTAFAVYRRTGDQAAQRTYKTLVKLSDSRVTGPEGRWPELIVCAAANVTDYGEIPPGRNAVPFVFTPGWIGGKEIGYIRTAEYEQRLGECWKRDITLPAAMAMSGALSPSMGKMTSPAHTFLLALANARLGVWLPNPHKILSDSPGIRQPAVVRLLSKMRILDSCGICRPRMVWLLREMRGLNKLDADYLYVTDGGHYENLGLLELLRRGCTKIYCFDASGDDPGTYATIGQAIALARTELGIDIPLNPDELAPPDPDRLPDKAFVRVEFRYPNDEPGELFYATAMLTADLPWDVRAYRIRDPQFPHDSTRQQMYSGERFEAYRALGERTALRILQDQGNATALSNGSSHLAGPPDPAERLLARQQAG